MDAFKNRTSGVAKLAPLAGPGQLVVRYRCPCRDCAFHEAETLLAAALVAEKSASTVSVTGICCQAA